MKRCHTTGTPNILVSFLRHIHFLVTMFEANFLKAQVCVHVFV